MSVVIVIPARFASTRYPGKPLAMLKGATGQSLSLIEMPKLTPKQNIEAVTMADRTNVAVAMQSSSAASGASIT